MDNTDTVAVQIVTAMLVPVVFLLCIQIIDAEQLAMNVTGSLQWMGAKYRKPFRLVSIGAKL